MPLLGPPDTDGMLPAGVGPGLPTQTGDSLLGVDLFFILNRFMNIYGHDNRFTSNSFNRETGIYVCFTSFADMHVFSFNFTFKPPR